MKTNKKSPKAPALTTFTGTKAYRLSDAKALRRTIASCLLFEDQFYEDGEAIAERIKRLTLAVEPEVAAAIARDARTKYKLRHAPLWIARWLASGSPEQKAQVPTLLHDIIQRPDELSEFLALYWKSGKTPLANCVKKGLASAFTKFNAYSLAKFDRPDAIKLRDVMHLVHAKPIAKEDAPLGRGKTIPALKNIRGPVTRHSKGQGETFRQLIEGTLPTPNTWETRLSGGEDKKAVFTELLQEGKLGAHALLQNLRNMREAGVDQQLIASYLQTVSVEKVLPFRFLKAAEFAPNLEPHLEQAMFRCLADLPKLKGRTALVIDCSGSMDQKIAGKSELSRRDAAAALAMLCRETCEEARVYWFHNTAGELPARRGFALKDAISSVGKGGSYGGKALKLAEKDGYDRIIVLTDGEWHTDNNSFNGRNALEVAGKPLTDKAYLVNVASYTNAVGSGQWNMIDGWSESLLDYIATVEDAQ